VLNARGGYYSSPEAQPMEMSVNYVKNVFGGVAGMTLFDEVIIEGHNANPSKAEEIIAEGIEAVKASAHKLATVNA
ncbi:MAG TPA: FMN-dependent NADH-azoreductase, partial [Ureibacillus sp.]|nr:FMN-dependent NADH-azoreductase [Ureibacillus sp.]